jgi:hypothetical protein
VCEAVQPVERFADLLILETGGVEFARERVVVGIRLGLVVVLKQIHEDFEHGAGSWCSAYPLV